jgi:UDP-N-acetylglucosamine 2-epimerase (non-hydrolysing)
VLIGDDLVLLRESIGKIIRGEWKTGAIPPLWDGKTAERIIEAMLTIPL